MILNIGIVEPIFQPQLSRAQDKIPIVCAFISSAVIEVLLHVIMCVKKYNRIYTFYLFMNSGELEQRARPRGEGQWKLLGVFFLLSAKSGHLSGLGFLKMIWTLF